MNEKDLIERYISYSVVTKPIKGIKWKQNALLQDDKDPYHYLRILPDKRIIVGGEDTKFKLKPINNKLALKKYASLINYLKKMLPNFKNQIEIEYCFCGAFGSTNNNLGLIGKTENPKILYFLSAGANGILNAMYGSLIIEKILKGESSFFEHLFSPLRK